MTVSDLRRLKVLESENRRLKQIVAEQALDNRTLKQLLSNTVEYAYVGMLESLISDPLGTAEPNLNLAPILS